MSRLAGLPRDVQYFLLMKERPIYQAILRSHLPLAANWDIFLRDYSAKWRPSLTSGWKEYNVGKFLDLCAERMIDSARLYVRKHPKMVDIWKSSTLAYQAEDWPTAHWILEHFGLRTVAGFHDSLDYHTGKRSYLDFISIMIQVDHICPYTFKLSLEGQTPPMLAEYHTRDTTSLLWLTLLGDDLNQFQIWTHSWRVWDRHSVFKMALKRRAWKIACYLLTTYELSYTRSDRFYFLKKHPEMATEVFLLLVGTDARSLIEDAAQKKKVRLLWRFFDFEDYQAECFRNLTAVYLLLQDRGYLLLNYLREKPANELMNLAFEQKHFDLVAELRTWMLGWQVYREKLGRLLVLREIPSLAALYERGLSQPEINRRPQVRDQVTDYLRSR